MQARFIHDGRALDFLPETNTAAGTVIVQGSLIGITKTDISADCLGAIHVTGVFDVVKANIAVPVGSRVYWDATAKNAVLNAAGNTQIGIAVAAAGAEAPVVRVRLL